MAFDPDAYLAGGSQDFNPDAWLADNGPTSVPESSTDPNAFMWEPSVGEKAVIEKPARAVVNYAKGMIPQTRDELLRAANIPTDWTDPVQLTEAAIPGMKPMLDTAQGAQARWQQIQQAEQTPPWSQERWNAGIGTVGDLAQLALLRSGAEHLPESELVDQIRAQAQAPEGPAIAPESPVSRPVAETASISPDKQDLQPGQPQVTIPATGQQRPRIVAAAIQDAGTGKTFTGPSHPQIYDKFPQIEGDPGEAFTGEGWNTGGNYIDGFVDQNGKFYDREEAANLAGLRGEVSMGELEAVAGKISHDAPYKILKSNELQASDAEAGQSDTAPAESASVGSSETQGIGSETGSTDTIPPEDQRYAGVSTKNEYTEGRREALGMEPRDEVTPRSDQSVQDAADALRRRTPDIGARIAAGEDFPQVDHDTKNVLLRDHISDLEKTHAELVDHINKTQDPAAIDELNRVRDQRLQAFDTAEKTGTSLARGLRQRQVAGEDQYTLPKMEAETRAVNGGKPLAAPKLKQVAELQAKIEQMQKMLDAREKAITEGRARPLSKARRGIVDYMNQQADAARARLIAKRGRLNVGIDPTSFADEIIIGASHIAKGIRNFDQWGSAMLNEFGDRVKPYLRELYENARRTYKEATASQRPSTKPKPSGATAESVKEFDRQDRYRTATIKKTQDLMAKTKAGDVSPPPQRADLILDPVSQKLRDNLNKAKYDYQVMLEKDRLAKRPGIRKLADFGVSLERMMKLTGAKVFGKLGSAGGVRVGQTAAEGALAKAMSYAPVLRKVMAAAPTEGAPTLRSAAAYGKGMVQGVKDIPGVIKGKILTRDVKEGSTPKVQSWMDIPGRIHGAVKQPFKKAAEAASFQKALDTAVRQGKDINKPGVIEAAQAQGKEAGLRAIFTNDNLLSNGWNNFTQWLEGNKKYPTAGYIGAKVGQFLLPIVRVPTNIAIEAGTMNTGLLTGSFKLAQVMKRGMETIRPEEADMIARHYKKGLVGAGLFLTGYFNRDKFGGFYQDFRTKKSDKVERNGMQPGQAKFNGMTIPDWILLHSPAGLVMQEGAMVGKLMDTGKSSPESYLSSASKIVQEIPFVREMSAIDDLLKGNWEAKRAGGNLLKSSVVPQGLQDVASYMDKWNSGLPRKRSPETALQYIMNGIPVLRENYVPLSKHQYP